MTNLTQKIDELQQQLATQHTELLARLDTIAAGLGTPTSGTTLADVVAVLNDIHTDTISQDQKLLIIRNSIERLVAAIYPNGYAPDATLSNNMHQSLAAIARALWGTTNYAFTGREPLMLSALNLQAQLKSIVGDRPPDASQSLLWYLKRLFDGIGLPFGGLTLGEMVFDQLAATQQLAPPQPPTSATCSNQFASTLHSIANGRRWIQWPSPLPAGVIYESGAVLVNTQIKRTGGVAWTGYQLYVFSASAEVFKIEPFDRYLATNRWHSLDLYAGPIGVSVAQGEDVSAYLCLPAGVITQPPAAGCITANSISSKLSTQPTTYQFANWLSNGTNQALFQGDTISNSANANIFLPGNFKNWTLKNLSNVQLRWFYYLPDTTGQLAVTNAYQNVIVLGDTNVIYVRASNSTPFQVEVCPP